MSFAHLHVHTEYSLLDGSNKIKECISRAKELGMNSVAITDHGVMYGVVDFYRAAKEQGINPIIGCEIYVAPKSRYDREIGGGEEWYYHLVLLAKNNTGYHNLVKIVSKGFTEGYYYKPRVDREVLEQYSEGLIALSACLGGEVPNYILRGDYQGAKEAALWHKNCFGEGNYYLELQDHGLSKQQEVNPHLLRLSKDLEIPLVVTNDIHYTRSDDEKAHDILLCIQTGKKLSDENRMHYEGGQYYMKSEEEMMQLFPYAREAIENTQKIADQCHVEFEFGVTKLPKYTVPEEYTSTTYLEKICQEGLKERYRESASDTEWEALNDRLQFELKTINNMGYVDYFLITWDFINYAKRNDIMVGPGRGSAAGSIVSYCLHITDIDPIKYQLLFERFLNPERVSMPDIDIDFCFERRQEVIQYVCNKYGMDKVVQIVTFGTMAAKGVIRDVGRVMDLPYSYVDSIAKMIPVELGITIDKALAKNGELQSAYESEEQVRYLIDMCKRLEGLPRHASMHAAGVVICQQSADEFVPLSRGSDGAVTTQFPMTTLEELGLLKMDFLGLRTLTVIQSTCNLVNAHRSTPLSMEGMSYDDPQVLALIGSGKTDGIFQLESAGMKSFMKELKPQSLEDIIAGVSLYRPGPMDFIPKYIKGKNHHDEITYACKELEPILAPTYGCIVYQEQVMQIVRELGGYTLGRSDLVRRAMSKKKQAVMEKERDNFVYGNQSEGVAGCMAIGISEKVAIEIYDMMMDFAKYAFNKSHAACYAVIAYQTAYLKQYHQVEFMAALMTSVIDNSAKVSEYILACRNMGIGILPPDVNEGQVGFSVTNDSIRFALNAIKGIGKQLVEALVEERVERGSFLNLKDFITRMLPRDLNKRNIENLIKAGALDGFEGNRKQFMSVYIQIVDDVQQNKKHNLAGQITLFDFAPVEEKASYEVQMPQVEEYAQDFMLSFEKEVLGIYISGHPLEQDEACWKKTITGKTTDFIWQEETQGMNLHDNERVTIGGIVVDQTIKYTRNDKVMAFLTVEDLVGTLEVVVFPKVYEKYQAYLKPESKIFIKGRVSAEDERDGKLIAEAMLTFDEVPKKLWVKFATREVFESRKNELFEQIAGVRGNDTIVIYIEETKEKITTANGQTINATEHLLRELEEAYGVENVKLV